MPELRELSRPMYHHDFMSGFEDAARDLLKLGVLNDVFESTGRRFVYFSFNCSPDGASEVAERNWRNGPLFDELLTHFIALFGGFGTKHWGFSTKRNFSFGADSRIRSTLDALVSVGYLSKAGDGYVWTSRAAAALESAGY